MSSLDACMEVINPILQKNAPINAQFPFLFFSEPLCQGKRYPPEGAFNLWEQTLSADQIGFSEIRSVYVPPQSQVELFAVGGDGYYSVIGPQVIPDTESQLAFWRNWDDSPCFSGETNCGNRVIWKLASAGGVVARLRVHNPVSWTETLAILAAKKAPVKLNGVTYPVDNDALYQGLCTDGQDRFQCDCHDAFREIQIQHPGSVNNSYVNILQNGCNPLSQFVPSGALVGQVNATECQNQINSQLKSGTFPTLNNGGNPLYICSGISYLNAYEDGTLDTLARFDDDEDDVLEAREMTSVAPSYSLWIMGGLLLLALFMIMFYYLRRSALRGRLTRHKIRRRKRSERFLE